ncbi:hypothetical protein [Gluconacetobacter takamatsuzukensis]|uniref:Glycosyltransferase RgtA/B/C/D-like domain-containing protein n=1 Tax=Gluconacetobacter takamatsuzukensis TaxID=1286190 RepID=A0A7W4KD73_9PROT|nr:hypothetical protein [Gluconacetobacter takamatsuzukensis]MBB2204792.1 hypothetical protein [Gluconacetobacter takamatsuzukensis]
MTDPRASFSLRSFRLGMPPLTGLMIPAIYALALFSSGLLGDGDTFWHVASGNWILAHRAVPHVDPFSYTFVGQPWTAHEWLSEVLFAAAFDLAGWSGVLILTSLAVALTAILLAGVLARYMGVLATWLTTMVALGCVTPSLLARPHMLALPAMAAWTIALLRARARNTTPGLPVLVIMVVWANLHGSFALGLALTIAFAVEAVADRPDARLRTAGRWGGFFLLAVLAARLTPNGWHGLLFPVELIRMPELARIAEWQPINVARNPAPEVALLALVYIALTRRLSLPPIRLLILMGLIHLCLHHVRNSMVVGVIAPLILAAPLGRALDGREGAEGAFHKPGHPAREVVVLICALLLVTGGRLLRPVTLDDSNMTPISALNSLPAAVTARPVLNAYQFGGYLIFRGIRPFVDGRADMYRSFINDYRGLTDYPDHADFARAAERFHLGWTIFPSDSAIGQMLDTQPGWRRVYSDRFAVVHMRVADDDGVAKPK